METYAEDSLQIIAFDIGIKNFAYCILNVATKANTRSIQHLDLIDLGCKKGQPQKIMDAVLELLDDIVYSKMNLQMKTVVLIESQMTSAMKAIQVAINVYFKLLGRYESLSVATKYMSPKLKLKLIEKYPDYKPASLDSDKTDSSYKKNNLDSVQFTYWLLENKEIHPEIVQKIRRYKKKDDVCDACLMTFAAAECAQNYLKEL